MISPPANTHDADFSKCVPYVPLTSVLFSSPSLEAIEIDVLDHVIVAGDRYYSMASMGNM